MSDSRKRRQTADAKLDEDLRGAYASLLSEPVPSAMVDAGEALADRLTAAMEHSGLSPVARAGGEKETAVASLDQRIRERAYRLWMEEGQPDGRADRYWAAAAALVQDEDAAAAAETAPLGADPAATVSMQREEPAGD